MGQTSNIRSIISHWGAEYGVNFTETHDSKNRWSKNIAPIVMYHGDADTTIPIKHGEYVKSKYNEYGVDCSFNVIKGAAHGCWNNKVTLDDGTTMT